MADFPALPLWTDAYLADTRHLSRSEHGAYLLLLMEAWRRPRCSLPDDDALLARLTCSTAEEWAALKPVVMAFWKLDKKRREFTQKRLTKEHGFVGKKSVTQRAKARTRWNKTKNTDAAAMPEGMPDGCPGDAPTPTPTPTPTVRKKGSLSPPNTDANRREGDLDTQSSKSPENGHDQTAEIVAAWNETAAELGLATVRTLTDKRRKLAKAALKQIGGIEAFREAIGRIGQSDFLLGHTSREGWKADFDFVLRPDKLVKLAEGAYSNRAPPAPPAPTGPVPPNISEADWDVILAFYFGHEGPERAGRWATGYYGPKPGEPGCFAPAHLVEKYRRPPMKGDTRTGDAA